MNPHKKLFALLPLFFIVLLVMPTSIVGQTKKKAQPAKKASSKQSAAKKTAPKAATKKTAVQKVDPKKAAAEKKALAEKRRKEEERRQSALAEKRRREQAAREARARKIAFENGLKTETIRNIQKDNFHGEDVEIRRAAVNALGSHAGTVVVMESQTGRILTIVNQEWGIKNGFKPCSTIKLVTGVAGISEGLIDSEGGINNSSFKMELDDALAYSNNAYFQHVGAKLGNQKMIEYAQKLGLGQPTGINAEGEYAGKLPFGNSNPRIYSHADDFLVTPLQLAVMVSALSNGGKRVVPRIHIPRNEKTAFRAERPTKLDIDQQHTRGVLPGMIGAASYGTARRGVDSSMGVAGKTGSCIGGGSWVGLFASVAPVADPRYAVVVITRGESERGRIAAAIAGKVYTALAPMLKGEPKVLLAQDLKPKHKTTTADANKAGREDEDDAELAESQIIYRPQNKQDAERDVVVVGAQKPTQRVAENTPPARQNSTPMKAESIFPPVVITFKRDQDEEPVEPPSKAKRQRIVEKR